MSDLKALEPPVVPEGAYVPSKTSLPIPYHPIEPASAPSLWGRLREACSLLHNGAGWLLQHQEIKDRAAITLTVGTLIYLLTQFALAFDRAREVTP